MAKFNDALTVDSLTVSGTLESNGTKVKTIIPDEISYDAPTQSAELFSQWNTNGISDLEKMANDELFFTYKSFVDYILTLIEKDRAY